MEKNTHNPETFADYALVFASAILFFLFSNLLITGIVFLFHGHIVVSIAWISLLLTAIFTYAYGRLFFNHPIPGFFLIVASVFAVCFISVVINKNIYDISYDGQTYQQEAIIQLSEGWNPVYQNLSSEIIGGEQKWINYYPKSSWINESYIYLLTHEQRDAKSLNIILMFVSAALIYAALTDTGLIGKFDAIIISILLAANPVSLYQSLSFYLDGQLMSIFLCIVATALILYKRTRKFAFVPFFLLITIFINLKFTALLDAIILITAFIVIAWIKQSHRLARDIFYIGSAALVIGVLIIGTSPYITNIIRYRTPFYPLLGPGAIDLKPSNVPGNFIDKNSTEILFLSFFSESEGVKGIGTTSTYQFPFAYSNGELVAFRYPDANEGGFGPLFGGAVIIAFIIMFEYRLVTKRGFYTALGAMLFVIGLSIIDPISSLARYVPQAYLIAVIPIVLLLTQRKTLSHVFAYLALAFLFFNSYLIGITYFSYNIRISKAITADLAMLAQQSQTSPILVYFNEFKSTRIMLQEAGVDYTATEDPNACPVGFRTILPENTTEFCVDWNS